MDRYNTLEVYRKRSSSIFTAKPFLTVNINLQAIGRRLLTANLKVSSPITHSADPSSTWRYRESLANRVSFAQHSINISSRFWYLILLASLLVLTQPVILRLVRTHSIDITASDEPGFRVSEVRIGSGSGFFFDVIFWKRWVMRMGMIGGC